MPGAGFRARSGWRGTLSTVNDAWRRFSSILWSSGAISPFGRVLSRTMVACDQIGKENAANSQSGQDRATLGLNSAA